jgi:porcupine-like protein
LVAYKEAFSFRTSHYFISYLAEAGMIASGFTNTNKKDVYNQFRFIVTEPQEIEFPSSLSVVVRKWNQPMHDFLKKCLFFFNEKLNNLVDICRCVPIMFGLW